MMGSEHQEQVAIFQWIDLKKETFPELSLLFSIPNGSHRHIGTAVKLKREGVKSGVSDMFLPVATKGFNGLWLELKVGKNKATKHQMLWLNNMVEQGYMAVVCVGAAAAIQTICDYLEIDNA